MKIRMFLCALQLVFAVSSMCFGKLGTFINFIIYFYFILGVCQ